MPSSGINAGIDRVSGKQRAIFATPDGRLEVDVADDEQGTSLPVLMARLCWEMQELRRVQCEATDQLFKKWSDYAAENEE